MILASACLLGLRCRYDGRSDEIHPSIAELKNLIPVCPEQLGGLPTPREPADFTEQDLCGEAVLEGRTRITTSSGNDVTAEYVRGAEETAALAQFFGVKKAFMRRRSPSCGLGKTYCRGKIVDGNGVTAAMLAAMGIEIIPLGGV